MDDQHPVVVVVRDDLRRSRVTVFFRLLLGVPHYIWFFLWTALVVVVAIAAWVITLAAGRLPRGLHRFFSAYVRYVAHVAAYIGLVGNPFPGFAGDAYPIEIRLPDAPERQARLKTLFRIFLALPMLLLAGLAGGGGPAGMGTLGGRLGLTGLSAVLGWFASLVLGRMPRGLRDAGAYGIGNRAQLLAYLLFLTDRYPTADPATVLSGLDPPEPHPVRIESDSDDLRRSRVTVLFRLPLLIPLVVWAYLWAIAVFVAAIVQWFITLFRGRPAVRLHAFLSRYVRFTFHVWAFGSITGNPFPGFTGRPASYPLELELPPAARQNRWKTGFRLLLVFPAGVVNSALSGMLFLDAIFCWFTGLILGRVPHGIRNLSVYSIRYAAQLNAYALLLTDRYPLASPLEGAVQEPGDVATPELQPQFGT